MKDILIVAHYMPIPSEERKGRFNYIAEKINKKNAKVEIITSSFSHEKKRQKEYLINNIANLEYNLTLLYEPDYKKNVSIKRLISHNIFANNLKKYLKTRKRPDVIYCAVPSLSVAKVVSLYAKNNKIKLLLDIQDLWPEAFKMILPFKKINHLLFLQMNYTANKIYSAADEIVAVSNTYANRAIKINNKVKKAQVVYLGTDLQKFDLLKKDFNQELDKNNFIVGYIGTLGHSYDIECVIDAINILENKGIKNIEFLVMGDGPLKERFIKYAKLKNINCTFTGRLNYNDMVKKLVCCDVAVNPITKGSAGSIINKVCDYAAAGLPVLNTQESKEYRDMINTYKSGINCKNNNAQDLSEKMLKLYNNIEIRIEMGKNNRKVAEDLFDRNITYKKIVELLE